jgi:hypothetical protein
MGNEARKTNKIFDDETGPLHIYAVLFLFFKLGAQPVLKSIRISQQEECACLQGRRKPPVQLSLSSQ